MCLSVTTLVAAEHATGRCPLRLTMAARFMRLSCALLAPPYTPACVRDDAHHVFVEILSAVGAPSWTAICDAVAAE